MKEIELLNTETNKTFKAKFGILNGIRFNKLAEIDAQFRSGTKEVNMLYMIAQSNKDVLDNLLATDESIKPFANIIESIASGKLTFDQVSALFESDKGNISKGNMQKRIEIIKVMLDTTSLSDKEEKLIATEEFWEAQDYEVLQEAGDYFRSKLRK